jgi:hypothetical protein
VNLIHARSRSGGHRLGRLHPSRSTGSPRCPFLADRSQERSGFLRVGFTAALSARRRAPPGAALALRRTGSTSEGRGALPSILCGQRSRERTAVVLHDLVAAQSPFSVARGASAAPRAAVLVKRLGRPLQPHGAGLIGTIRDASRMDGGGAFSPPGSTPSPAGSWLRHAAPGAPRPRPFLDELLSRLDGRSMECATSAKS